MRKVALILAALAVAALSVADYLAWRASHRRLLSLTDESGLSRWLPDVGRDLRRETVPGRAATFLAWRLLVLEIDRDRLADLPAGEWAEESARGLERLRLAEELAAQTLPVSPASWRAAAVLGASRYLAAARERRAVPSTAAWRDPLAAAMRLAPGQAEPPFLLASAYLSRWSSLSPAERAEALPALARAFATPRELDLLLPVWVRVAPSLATLLEPIPDRPPAWQRLADEFRRRGDLERFASARGRWLDSMPAFLAGRVAEARARLRAGNPRPAGQLLRSVLAAPHDLAFADSFWAAAAALPGELTNDRARGDLRRWLDWALDLCVIDRCPLEPGALAELAARIGDPAPVELALAALAANDPETAGRHEPAASGAAEPEWNRYWIYKTHRLAGDRPGEAAAALARASQLPPDELRYWHAAARLAEAVGDAASLDRARGELERLARPETSESAWAQRGPVLRRELQVARPADGLRLTFAAIPREGAAIELRWNGRTVGVGAPAAQAPHLWRIPIDPGLHLVEIENLTGRLPTPTALALWTGPPAA